MGDPCGEWLFLEGKKNIFINCYVRDMFCTKLKISDGKIYFSERDKYMSKDKCWYQLFGL